MATIQKKRKNKALPLVILLAVLVVMLIAYSALSASNDRKAAELAAEEAAANADILIAEYDYTTMSKLSYQLSGTDEWTFLNSAGVWSYAADANFPLDQTIVASMASAIATIGVECEVTEGSAADYGLDAPAYTIKVTYTDGTSHTYKIGDYNSFNDAYYFSADGDLYMVASGLLPYFDYTLEDLLALDTIPTSDWADANYLTDVTIHTAEKSNTISDTDGKTAVVDKISGISLTECSDYYATADEKAAYGLDGSTSAVVKYKKAVTSTDADGNESTTYLETTYTLVIGAAVGHNAGYYVSPSNSNMVYVVDETTVLELLAYADYTAPVTDTESGADTAADENEAA